MLWLLDELGNDASRSAPTIRPQGTRVVRFQVRLVAIILRDHTG